MLVGCRVCGTGILSSTQSSIKGIFNRSIINEYEDAKKIFDKKLYAAEIGYYDCFIAAKKELEEYKNRIKYILLSEENEGKITSKMREKLINDKEILDSDLSSLYSKFLFKNNIKSLLIAYNTVLSKLKDANNGSYNNYLDENEI